MPGFKHRTWWRVFSSKDEAHESGLFFWAFQQRAQRKPDAQQADCAFLEEVHDADHHRDPARDALGSPQPGNAVGTVGMKGLWIRIQQALSAPLNARGAMLWLASQSINIALPSSGRWIEVIETRLPDGRQAFQAVEYPGQQSVTGVAWQILAWIQGRIST